MSARPHASDTSALTTFELTRFEYLDGERYEVEGRWSGVRGRLFIRPELTLSDGDGTRRLLADMAQKPWQASDGEPWSVAFPCSAPVDDRTRVELAVAPDITVPVRAGRGARGADGPAGGLVTAPAAARARAKATPHLTDPEPPAPDIAPVRKRRGLGVQLEEVRAQLEAARGELGAARGELEDARRERTRLANRLEAALARVEELSDALRVVEADRDRAVREATSRHEEDQRRHERVVEELEQARAAEQRWRDEHRELDAAHRALEDEFARAAAEGASVEAERETVFVERERGMELAERALADREHAVEDQTEALAVRDRALAEREAIVDERERRLEERDQALAALARTLADFEAGEHRDGPKEEPAPADVIAAPRRDDASGDDYGPEPLTRDDSPPSLGRPLVLPRRVGGLIQPQADQPARIAALAALASAVLVVLVIVLSSH